MKALLIIQNIERFLFKRAPANSAENGEDKSNENQDELTVNSSMDPFHQQLITLVSFQNRFFLVY